MSVSQEEVIEQYRRAEKRKRDAIEHVDLSSEEGSEVDSEEDSEVSSEVGSEEDSEGGSEEE